ncbi:MAG: hypothetical protein LBQ96_05495, partial [Fusobacteriaceae bacterium]|nr:hypothetical protein [Fusobacteriaceae bacterium]
AYDVLVKEGYILRYEAIYSETEDTYYIHYHFNPAKDGTCHISQWFPENVTAAKGSPRQDIKLLDYKKKDDKPTPDFEEKAVEVRKDKKDAEEIEFPEGLKELFKTAKMNPYIAKAWNQEAEKRFYMIYQVHGLKTVGDIVTAFKKVTSSIKKGLVPYINGILKNKQKEAEEADKNIPRQLSLFSDYAREIEQTPQEEKKDLSGQPAEGGDRWENLLKGMSEEEKEGLMQEAVNQCREENPALGIDLEKVRRHVMVDAIVLPYVERILASKNK